MAGVLVPTVDFILILCSLTRPAISQALVDGRCSFVKTLALKYDKSLDGHVVASYPVEKEDDCQLKCFRHRLCVSYNLGPVLENRIRDCEISKSDEFRDPQNMTDRPGYFYRGTQNSCASGPCPRNATCIPNFESDVFQCECPAGFTGETCTDDIHECGQNMDDCHQNARCKNTVGSFKCFCKKGFTGNGRNCRDIDECQEQTYDCSAENAHCINTNGSYKCVCNVGFIGDGQVCKAILDCQKPLGMENGSIPDQQISASSIYNEMHAAHQGRLNFQASDGMAGAWVAVKTVVITKQWIRIDLGDNHTVTRVATQGRSDRDQWVTMYKLKYKADHNQTQNAQYYKEKIQGDEVPKEFSGNADRNTVVYHYLNPPIRARYIKFQPTAWYGQISMRVELYGCQDIDECFTGEHICDLKASCHNTLGSYTCRCNPPYQGNGFTCQDPVPPTFLSVPTSITVEEKQNVTFTCLADGLPLPVITWNKVDESLPVRAAVTKQESLDFLEVFAEDSGNYTCTATNIAGNITSPAAELVVLLILMFTILPPSGPIYIFAGDSLTLPCSADSDLAVPIMGWRMQYSGGVEIFPDNTLFIASAGLSHTGSYICTANNSFRTLEESATLYVHALPSCRDIKSRQINSSGNVEIYTSGYYLIDPDGGDAGEAPFEVFCDMTMYGNNSVTVISHDSENRTLVNGHELPGSYRRVVSYIGASLQQIVNLISVSVKCFQFIKFECYQVRLMKKDAAWWVSRDNNKMKYWGGAVPNSGKCACANNRSCVDEKFVCNCDSQRGEWLEDSGFLSDKSTLPVIGLRFGDTGAASEKGYHTLGKLMCIGEAIDMPSPIIPLTPAGITTATAATEVIPTITTSASTDGMPQISTSKSPEVIPMANASVRAIEAIATTILATSASTDGMPQISNSTSPEVIPMTNASVRAIEAIATTILATSASTDGMPQISTSKSPEVIPVANASVRAIEAIATTILATSASTDGFTGVQTFTSTEVMEVVTSSVPTEAIATTILTTSAVSTDDFTGVQTSTTTETVESFSRGYGD